MRCDMVYHGGFRVSPLPHALGAERMGLEVLPAYFLPLSCIATLTRWAGDFRVQRQVHCTVESARLNKLRATGVSARHLGSAGHGSFLPRQAGLSEVTVGTDLVVVHVQQAQTPDDTLRGQVVAVLDVSLDEVQRLVFRAEALHRHAHRLYHTDGIRQLDFALVSVTCLHDVLGDLPCHIRCGPVHLGGVFAAQGTSTHSTDTAVGIARQLTAGDTTGSQHHHGFDDVAEVAGLHIRAVLHRTEEGGDPAGVVVVADLCLGICPEHLARMVLQQLQELGGDHVGDRHLFGGLVGGVAVHDALVTGTALIHAQCNIRRLIIDQDADAEQFPEIKTHLVCTDAGDDLMDDLLVVGLVIGGDLAGDKELAAFQQTLDRYTGVLVVLKDVGHNGICDLVTDLIRVTVADLLTGDNLTHSCSSLSCITKQAAFAVAHKRRLPQKLPAKYRVVFIFLLLVCCRFFPHKMRGHILKKHCYYDVFKAFILLFLSFVANVAGKK